MQGGDCSEKDRGRLSERRAASGERRAASSEAAGGGSDGASGGVPVFAFVQRRCDDVKLQSGRGARAGPRCYSYLFLTRTTKAPHMLSVSRQTEGSRLARSEPPRRAPLSVIFVDRKQVWVSGHVVWLTVIQRPSPRRPTE